MNIFSKHQLMRGAFLITFILAGSSTASANSTSGSSGTSIYKYAPLRAVKNYTVTLSGPAESPPNASPGTGSGSVTIDTVAQTMQVNVTFSGLTGNTTASHIHCCTAVPGTGTAGVATETPTFSGFPLGVTSGTFSHTFDMTQAGSYNPSFITANGGTPNSAFAVLVAGIDAGEAYLNIHTSTFGGGEIRGFIVSVPASSGSSSSAPRDVPEADTVLLLGGGLGGLATWVGWQKRRFAGRKEKESQRDA